MPEFDPRRNLQNPRFKLSNIIFHVNSYKKYAKSEGTPTTGLYKKATAVLSMRSIVQVLNPARWASAAVSALFDA
jgi:hypothetical protein